MTPARCRPQEFLWEKKGSPVPLQKGPDSVLLLPSFNDTHLGTYICTATSLQGRAVATYNLWTDGRDGTEGTAGDMGSPLLPTDCPHHSMSPCATAGGGGTTPGADAGGHLQQWQEQPPLSRPSQTW